MTPDCPDLRHLAGDRYRVANEVEGRRAHAPDPAWDLIVPGRGGFVAPWGPGRLVACTRGRGTTRKLLALVPGAAVVADGADGQNVVFGVAHLDAVAGLLYLRRRRRLSPERRQAEAARLAAFAFAK